MLKLCGFSASNYYNKVKLAMLEKGLAYEEELVYSAPLDASPMGKVPFLRTENGTLSESLVICDYLEERYPETPLYPTDMHARAKVRELVVGLDLYIELPVRRLYPEAFFGGKVSDGTKREVEQLLENGLTSLARIARFEPFIAGASYSLADCAAWTHLPIVSQVSRKLYGRNLLEEKLPAALPYLELISQRPASQRVRAEQKAAMPAFLQYVAEKMAGA